MSPLNRLRYPALLLGTGLLLGAPHSLAASMDHSGHAGHQSPAPAPTEPDMHQHAGHTMPSTPSPVPALTDADRAAVYDDPAGHHVHDNTWNSMLLVDKLEWQDADHGSALAWDVNGWVGGDIDRLWLRSEGERSQGRIEHAQVQALWGHAISPWWDVLGGVRQDFKPGAAQTWAAFGLQGMPLSGLETEATAFIGEAGQGALRLEAEYDLLITNRLILQPSAEVNAYARNDAERGVGSGLADSELGLRLRYEVRREFAPYIGVTWNRRYGNSADYARKAGEDDNQTRLVLGVRLWF